MWAHPGKQLLFMGSELADEREWSEERGLDWGLLRRPARAPACSRLVATSTGVYRATPALWTRDTTPAGFRWIDGDDAQHNTFAFVRFGADGDAAGLRGQLPADPARGLPDRAAAARGRWTEVINTDAELLRRLRAWATSARCDAEDVPWHGLPASAALRVPPLGARLAPPPAVGATSVGVPHPRASQAFLHPERRQASFTLSVASVPHPERFPSAASRYGAGGGPGVRAASSATPAPTPAAGRARPKTTTTPTPHAPARHPAQSTPHRTLTPHRAHPAPRPPLQRAHPPRSGQKILVRRG